VGFEFTDNAAQIMTFSVKVKYAPLLFQPVLCDVSICALWCCYHRFLAIAYFGVWFMKSDAHTSM
jgi:hypothetical protein